MGSCPRPITRIAPVYLQRVEAALLQKAVVPVVEVEVSVEWTRTKTRRSMAMAGGTAAKEISVTSIGCRETGR